MSNYKKLIGGNRSVWSAGTEQVIKEIEGLKLNSLTLSCKFNIPNTTSDNVLLDEQDIKACLEILQILQTQNKLDKLKIIFEPYPYINRGYSVETAFKTDHPTQFVMNWKNAIINTLAYFSGYNFWGIYCNSNMDFLKDQVEEWNNLYFSLKALYPASNIMIRTNWWYSIEDDLYSFGLNTRTTHEYYKIWDVIAIAAYFELGSEYGTASATEEQIKYLINNGTITYGRGQIIKDEIQFLSQALNCKIFFGELGIPSLENAVSQPYNVKCGALEDQETQKNWFKAWHETFIEEEWFLGWSIFVIADINNSPYGVYNKQAGEYTASLDAINNYVIDSLPVYVI